MKKLLLIDANSLIHRAFHALPPLTGKGGVPTGALYGLAGALLKILKEHKPDYAAAAFDRPEPTFRKEMFGDYKAHRPKTPDELAGQINEARNLFKEFGINYFERPGFEADDIIGTFVKKFGSGNVRIVILTGDLDTLQLIKGKKIIVETPKKGISETTTYDEEAVKKRYGLAPNQMTDYKGLVGDPSDNIPGVRGVGPKTAEISLSKYGSLEKIFEKMPASDPAAKKILPFKKEAFFSKKLSVIDQNVPIDVSLPDIGFSGLDKRGLAGYFEKFGFESLIRRLGNGEDEKKTAPRQKTQLQEKLFPLPEPKTILEKESKKKFNVAWEWKPVMKKLIAEKREVPKDIFDVSVAGWLLNPDETPLLEMLKEKFSKGGSLEKLSLALAQKIEKEGLERVFYEIEMPLVEVLAWVETWGVKVDERKLEDLLGEIKKKLSVLTKNIYAAAGGTFNINSSRQIAEMLFEKLKIKTDKNKRTGTGLRSTSEEVLSSLRKENPIAGDILDYRETFKVKSTYVEPLLELRGADGRVRTNFIQTGTSTGRLASEKPNLQNIPQESEWAEELRAAFIPDRGCSFLSFDYAQLELRLLAHMANDEKLIEAFAQNRDIHTLTASRVLKIPFSEVTHADRRLGKTLNFGVVYGMGPRAFAQSAGVEFAEARKFIDDYYREFPKVKRWQDEVKARTKARGYVENLNGRRRWFWTDARHPKELGEIERAAVNMPLQSLGADILKMAMIKSFDLMKQKGWLDEKVKLILTIHDELLFEIRDDILKEAAPLIKEIMEGIYPLAAPLVAEIKAGKNWGALRKYGNE